MDGVMVDNNLYHKRAWELFVQQHGFNLPEIELKEHVYGKINRDILLYLFGEDITDADIIKYANEKERFYQSIYSDYIKPTKGLIEFLNLLHSQNIPIAVATSAPPTNVGFVLSSLGVEKYFQIIVDDTDVKKGKPDPEIYLTTAKKLNMNPSDCVVFEDSLSGVQSAINAGMKVVAITTTHTKAELSNANLVIDDFSKLDINSLINL